jgi:hypothetical protein
MSKTSCHGAATLALDELKKRAKRLGRAARDSAGEARSGDDSARGAEGSARGEGEASPQHKQMLLTVARQAGFRDWQHARQILSGGGRVGDDFGKMWIGRSGGGFLNEWFASYDEARRSWEAQSGAFLLPYGRQFVVVGRDLMHHHGVTSAAVAVDLVEESGNELWDAMCRERLRHLFSTL